MLKEFIAKISKIYEDALEPEIIQPGDVAKLSQELTDPDEKDFVTKQLLARMFGVSDKAADQLVAQSKDPQVKQQIDNASVQVLKQFYGLNDDEANNFVETFRDAELIDMLDGMKQLMNYTKRKKLGGDTRQIAEDIFMNAISEGKRQVIKAYVETEKMSQEVLDQLLEKDPTPQNKYIDWMAKMYVKGGFTELEQYDVINDFNNLLNNNRLEASEKDIQKYKSPEEVFDVVQKYSDTTSKSQEKKKMKEEEVEKVFENDKVLVVKPKSTRASCQYGAGSQWCTASTGSYNYFRSYYLDRMVNLYYILPKIRMRKNYEKMAVAVHPSGQKEVYLANDKYMSYDRMKPTFEKLGIPL